MHSSFSYLEAITAWPQKGELEASPPTCWEGKNQRERFWVPALSGAVDSLVEVDSKQQVYTSADMLVSYGP